MRTRRPIPPLVLTDDEPDTVEPRAGGRQRRGRSPSPARGVWNAPDKGNTVVGRVLRLTK